MEYDLYSIGTNVSPFFVADWCQRDSDTAGCRAFNAPRKGIADGTEVSDPLNHQFHVQGLYNAVLVHIRIQLHHALRDIHVRITLQSVITTTERQMTVIANTPHYGNPVRLPLACHCRKR
jgi:hypothetical protein